MTTPAVPPNPDAGLPTNPPPITDPQAKAIVDKLNQENQELYATFKREVESAGTATAAELTVIKAKFADMANVIQDLDVKLAKMQRAAGTPQADLRPHRHDPREKPEWTAACNHWFRAGGSADQDALKVLATGNKFWDIASKEKGYLDGDPKTLERIENAVSAGGLQTDFGPGAGVWARPQLETEVSRLLVEYSPIRAFARVVPVGSGRYVGVIRNANRDTIEQIQEGVEPTQQTQKDRYEERTIAVYTYWATPGLTQEMIEDSLIDLTREVTDDCVLDFAVDEATNFVNGSGANEPAGYAVDSAVGGVTSRTANTIDHHDLTDLMLSLRPFYRTGAAYSLSTTAFRLAILEEDGNGRRLWQPAQTEGLPSLLNGFRYFEATEQAAVATAAKPVFFANWQRFYRIIDRRGLRIIRNETRQRGLVILEMSRRYGGRTWLTEAGKALTVA